MLNLQPTVQVGNWKYLWQKTDFETSQQAWGPTSMVVEEWQAVHHHQGVQEEPLGATGGLEGASCLEGEPPAPLSLAPLARVPHLSSLQETLTWGQRPVLWWLAQGHSLGQAQAQDSLGMALLAHTQAMKSHTWISTRTQTTRIYMTLTWMVPPGTPLVPTTAPTWAPHPAQPERWAPPPMSHSGSPSPVIWTVFLLSFSWNKQWSISSQTNKQTNKKQTSQWPRRTQRLGRNVKTCVELTATISDLKCKAFKHLHTSIMAILHFFQKFLFSLNFT